MSAPPLKTRRALAGPTPVPQGSTSTHERMSDVPDISEDLDKLREYGEVICPDVVPTDMLAEYQSTSALSQQIRNSRFWG